MKRFFLAALMLACGCSTSPTLFIRDTNGRLTGPIAFEPGTHFELSFGHYMVDVPRGGELETIARLKTTILPFVSFTNTPLAEVEQSLYCLQRQVIGTNAVPVYFVSGTAMPSPGSSHGTIATGDRFAGRADAAVALSNAQSTVTFQASYISVWQLVTILSHVTGLSYCDIRNGAVSLRHGPPSDRLPKVAEVCDPVDSEVARRFQQEVDSLSSILRNVTTPVYLSLWKSDQRRFDREFDVRAYFQIFTNISMEEGCVLDYVQRQWSLGCSPSLYARPLTATPFRRPAELDAGNEALRSNEIKTASVQFDQWRSSLLGAKSKEEAESAMLALCRQVTHATLDGSRDEYLNHVRIKDTSLGYLEYVALSLLGEQFYLGWHANYNDTRIVCTDEALNRLINELDAGPALTESDLFVLSSIDPRPALRQDGDKIRLSLVTFSKWGGITRRVFTLDRMSPHAMRESAEEPLWEHHCGVEY